MSSDTSRPRPRAREEAAKFASVLRAIRTQMGWKQPAMAQRLGVSRRTLVSWECGYWLPPPKLRVHLVLALKEASPRWLLVLADSLGVSSNPAAGFLLQEFHDAIADEERDAEAAKARLDPPPPEPPPEPPPPPPPAPPRATPEELKQVTDAIVWQAADALNVRPNDLRAVVSKLLSAWSEKGATPDDAAAAVAVTARRAEADDV